MTTKLSRGRRRQKEEKAIGVTKSCRFFILNKNLSRLFMSSRGSYQQLDVDDVDDVVTASSRRLWRQESHELTEKKAQKVAARYLRGTRAAGLLMQPLLLLLLLLCVVATSVLRVAAAAAAAATSVESACV